MQGRKSSGGKYKKRNKKKLNEIDGKVRAVKLGKEKKKEIKKVGGRTRIVLLSTDKVNVLDPKTKKRKTAKILNVIETPSNRFLARTNVLIKSAIIDTELGKAKITNRPSQESVVNAILIEEKK
jgi:small subunit ribosomal protein S8e